MVTGLKSVPLVLWPLIKLICGPGLDYPDLICAVLVFIEAADIQFSHFSMLHTLTLMYLHRNPIAENNTSHP